MGKAADLQKGSVVKFNGVPHVVEELQVQTPSARGASSLYKLRFRNLVTRQKEDKTFKGDDPVEETEVDRREVQFSYKQGDSYVFVDLSDYSEFPLNEDDLGEIRNYLVENMEGITALTGEGRILAIQMPDVVTLRITECAPSARNASATSRTKPATLSTGLVIQVPEYMSPGEDVRVDTRTGRFVSRA